MIPFLYQPSITFPNPETANADGLLAIGGSLTPSNAFLAHQLGIFPWYQKEQPILWWAPNPRCIIPTNRVHQSRSLAKFMRKTDYQITVDKAYEAVLDACSKIHGRTWITPEYRNAYLALFEYGVAHSCEYWLEGKLCGGLYGVSIDRVFCGESMFSMTPNASKIVLIEFCEFLYQKSIIILDTQFLSNHLRTMGAIEIPQSIYQQYLLEMDAWRTQGKWKF